MRRLSVAHVVILGLTAQMLAGCLASAEEIVPLVSKLVAGEDADFRAVGLERIRIGAKGTGATKQFAALLPRLPATAQDELATALAERGDPAALPAIVDLLKGTTDPGVKAAAIGAIGALGNSADVALLVKQLTPATPSGSGVALTAQQVAARNALTVLAGPETPASIATAAQGAAPGVRGLLLEVLANRRDTAAIPLLLTAAVDADADLRAAAMRSLAKLGRAAEVPGMVQGILKAAPGDERTAAEQAIITICTRGPARDGARDALLETYRKLGEADRPLLLPCLASVGGSGALEVIEGLVTDSDAARRKLGQAALAKWPDGAQANRVVELFSQATDPEERELLLAAVINLGPLGTGGRSDADRLDTLQKAMQFCQRDEDRQKVLSRADAIRTIESLRFLMPYLQTPALAEAASRSVVELAHHRNRREPNKEEFAKALDAVIGVSKDPEIVERAQRYKNGQTWERRPPANTATKG